MAVIALLPSIAGSQMPEGARGDRSARKEASLPADPYSYASGSTFTVDVVRKDSVRRHEVRAGISDAGANKTSFDLAVIQFRDDGTYLDSAQAEAAAGGIRKARNSALNANGALVILFIHGWHHGASWNRTRSVAATDPDGDSHFHAFRLVLESLALREAERYGTGGREAGRRVVGVYVAWHGDPEGSWLSRIPGITHATFWNRYGVAEKVGASAQFREAIEKIVAAAKEPVTVAADPIPGPRPESPLVMIGHSMGALMLQSALAALLEDRQRPLERQRAQFAAGPVEIRSSGAPVSFPDLVLSLNSAADSTIAKRIVKALDGRKLTKTAAAGHIAYSPPILMSVTSTGDEDTRDKWPRAKPGRRTDGHDSSLFTHTFALDRPQVTCNRGETVDMGQNWHCLRIPQPPVAATPVIPIDLPTRERNGVQDQAVPHARYAIVPKGSSVEPRLMWVFQVPPEIIQDHNDIFNSRARSLVLALIQISGAVASIAENWERSFEP